MRCESTPTTYHLKTRHGNSMSIGGLLQRCTTLGLSNRASFLYCATPRLLQHASTLSMTSRPRPQDFKYLTRVESVTGYVPGGYHPISIGDVLFDRYKIVHKLGYASFSTVWLARDEVNATYKAVKVLVSSSSVESREAEALRCLSENTVGASNAFIPALLDEFTVRGPNGDHRCLVTEVAGCCLARSTNSSPIRFFNMKAARTITAQVVLAISFLHSRGVAHGGQYRGRWRSSGSTDK